ncbi:MAG: hypothetical protein F6J93_29795 [Oscillatoria sp. SIO1A7]|nr:hypothetical protein [Oscillatoria sp. SIO1A7]
MLLSTEGSVGAGEQGSRGAGEQGRQGDPTTGSGRTRGPNDRLRTDKEQGAGEQQTSPLPPARPEPVVGLPVSARPEPVVGLPVSARPEPVEGPHVSARPEPVVGLPVSARPEPVERPPVSARPEPVEGPPVSARPEPVEGPPVSARPEPVEGPPLPSKVARGSARSVNQIDLYQLVKDQAHLLHRFGGHPMAAGLSLREENIPIFIEGINRQLRQQQAGILGAPTLQADLVVSVDKLGQMLFRELKLLEPCGMGNPVPQLLIENCWFADVRHRNIEDFSGRKVRYIKTTFNICDESAEQGFPGVWWGHYQDEIPQDRRCDAIVELDYNSYKKRYELRLTAVRALASASDSPGEKLSDRPTAKSLPILDWRNSQGDRHGMPLAGSPQTPLKNAIGNEAPPFALGGFGGDTGATTVDQTLDNLAENCLVIRKSPSSWDEVKEWYRAAAASSKQLAIAYEAPQLEPPVRVWEKLVGIAKYLSRTGKSCQRSQIVEKLAIGDRSLDLGLQTLAALGFEISSEEQELRATWQQPPAAEPSAAIEQFLLAITEEQFRRQYFSTVSLDTIQAMAISNSSEF